MTGPKTSTTKGLRPGDKPAKAHDARARRAARRVGLLARKSRWRAGSVDNRGGFMLIEPMENRCVRGWKFNLSAEDVIAFCAEAAK
jgi:hypothetical protein